MAKEKEEAPKKKDAEREARWEVACDNMRRANPLAYQARVDSGEYDSIPESFE
jgi:hypothetical protein